MTPHAAFEYLNRSAGIAPLGAPVFEGAEAVVPSPLRVATAAAASLGLGAAAAGEIWRFRGGEKQSVAVDLKAAAAPPENAAVAAIASAENNRRFIFVSSFLGTNMDGTAARGRAEISIKRPL